MMKGHAHPTGQKCVNSRRFDHTVSIPLRQRPKSVMQQRCSRSPRNVPSKNTASFREHGFTTFQLGLTIQDFDAIEINEAFASVVLAWEKELRPDMAKVNTHGGAIALGHPIGATGARLMTTLLHTLENNGGRYGLQTMCEGGGQANVTIIERLDS